MGSKQAVRATAPSTRSHFARGVRECENHVNWAQVLTLTLTGQRPWAGLLSLSLSCLVCWLPEIALSVK